jgi:predicted NAD-dependent protein-ADP-ribosyltransferase YbiA (DUF1768 family)
MVVSRIDKKVNYIENKKLETKDISKKRNLYELQIGNEILLQKNVVISIGIIQSIDGKEIYYFPIYLITKSKKAIQIGVYEIISRDKLLIYNEETDEVENTNLLNPPLFYSWVTNEFIEKNALLPSVIDEEERKKKEKVVEEVVEEEEEIIEENIPEYRKDIFEKQGGPIPPLLKEEKKEDADRYRKPNNMNEISQFMENENYNIINIPAMKNSDSLLYSIMTAFTTINQTTTEKKLRKKLSESKYIMKYLTSQKEKYNEMAELLTNTNTEKKTLTARHLEIKSEYDKIYKDPSRKEEAIKLGEENKVVVKTVNKLKEQEKKLKELIKPFEYLQKITTEEEMKEYIKSNNFISNDYVLSILEKILNIKFIVFLSDAIKENDTGSVIDCGLLDETVTNFKPEFYMMLEYSKDTNKYELVSYKNKFIFKFKEIPYDLKSMIITKCTEEVGSIFTSIPDFKSYELVGGKSSSNNIIYNYDYDDRKYDGVIIIIYCPSSKNKFPGEIKGEKLPTEHIKKYIQLSNYENWRCILDNNWSGYDYDETDKLKEYQFILDGYYWNSVQHYMQACKFKDTPSYYEKFSLGNIKEPPRTNDISKNVELAIFLGKKKGGIEFKGTADGEFKGKYRNNDIEIDINYDSQKDFYLKKALTAKFQQNNLFKDILLATHEAKLKYRKYRSAPIVATELMKVRDEIR